jgi:hypothetical protein
VSPCPEPAGLLTTAYKVEAAHRVIESGRTISETGGMRVMESPDLAVDADARQQNSAARQS